MCDLEVPFCLNSVIEGNVQFYSLLYRICENSIDTYLILKSLWLNNPNELKAFVFVLGHQSDNRRINEWVSWWIHMNQPTPWHVWLVYCCTLELFARCRLQKNVTELPAVRLGHASVDSSFLPSENLSWAAWKRGQARSTHPHHTHNLNNHRWYSTNLQRKFLY